MSILAPFINSKLSEILDINLRDSFNKIKNYVGKKPSKNILKKISPFENLLVKKTRRDIFSELKEYNLLYIVYIII